MASRQKLHDRLVEVIGDSKRVYFQPPESIKLGYPCIKYDYENDKDVFANDGLYKTKNRYTVTIIDRDPDCKFIDPIKRIPYTSFDRSYRGPDNLYHHVFTIFN